MTKIVPKDQKEKLKQEVLKHKIDQIIEEVIEHLEAKGNNTNGYVFEIYDEKGLRKTLKKIV